MTPAPRLQWRCRPGTAAVAAVVVLALCLAWRPIGSEDIGYHLAYGDSFFRTGHIVDDSGDFVYTDIDRTQLAIPGDLPPGAWYDSQRQHYGFPNSNYASQIVMSLAYRMGGFTGLCLLQLALTGVAMALTLLTMRRLAVPWTWMAAGSLLATLLVYERLSLRPEMFGFVLQMAILYLLCTPRIRWRTVVLIVLAQWAFVQFHISWILGPALATAFLAESVLQAGWARMGKQKPLDEQQRKRLTRLAVTVGCMILVVFVNPWTWRLAALPVQTAQYMHSVVNPWRPLKGVIHPWVGIEEFRSPFEERMNFHTRFYYAYIVTLALSAVAAAAAFHRRKWALLFILVGIAIFSLSMRRTAVQGGFLLVPVALAPLADRMRNARFKAAVNADSRSTRWILALPAVLILALATYWIRDVVTDRFYYTEKRPFRFGAGKAVRRNPPFAAAELLRSMPEDWRVFTSYYTSSTVMYFGGNGNRHRAVPVLTNTWAYPVSTLAENNALCTGSRDFAPFAVRYNVRLAVIECTDRNKPLLKSLLGSPDWTPAHFDGMNIMFARSDLNTPSVFRDFSALQRIIADIKANERRPVFWLNMAGASLYTMGLYEQAEKLYDESVSVDETNCEAWNMLGATLFSRGVESRNLRNVGSGESFLLAAGRCFQRALTIDPSYYPAKENVRRLDKALSEIRR